MAVDETLLNQGLSGIATLRFYQWDSPTISLGHFQAAQGQFIPERFKGLASVRRLSGGGAILHHHELTYSCVLPAWHPVSREPSQLYHVIHDAIVEVLTQLNVPCQLRRDEAFADQPFLCFARGDERDIVIGRDKIVGSAQRRRQGTILQHGSLLLKQSDWAPEFPGIKELVGQEIKPVTLIPLVSDSVSARLNLRLRPDTLSDEELAAVDRSLSSKML